MTVEDEWYELEEEHRRQEEEEEEEYQRQVAEDEWYEQEEERRRREQDDEEYWYYYSRGSVYAPARHQTRNGCGWLLLLALMIVPILVLVLR